ncbi:hypothetical protein ACFTWH_06245 [Streptomyces sp. NPDC057011]|uniref:hypothetical protein n=1 Tax=unclassified Streptomyces TaxID=2593676 RepID=UPI003635E84B
METVVQWVRTSWTKQSRGGPGAALRNAAPVAFPLPRTAAPFVQEVLMHEADAFEPRFVTHSVPPEPDAEPSVLLREEDGLLRVQPAVTPFGMPRRWRRPPAVRLARGEWLRWQVNHRFAGSHGDAWTYRLDTLNLAYGPHTPADLFMGTPTRQVSELAALR